MTVDADALLAGPRGRRLCLAVALRRGATDEWGRSDLRTAVMHAALDLDPGAGASRVVVAVGRGAEEYEPPHVSAAEVATLVDQVTLHLPAAGGPDDRAPDPHRAPPVAPEAARTAGASVARPGVLHPEPLDDVALLLALREAVDSARHWQGPDGEDVLAATPEVRAALRRVAVHVAACPAVTWWDTPVDVEDQWTVTFDGAAAPAVEGTATQRLDRWRVDEDAAEARAGRERPADPRAPWSGWWWSIPVAGLRTTTRRLGARGPVGLWCVEDTHGWEAADVRRLVPPREPRVIEVDSADAWVELCRRHPLEVTAGRRHDWFRATGRVGRWCVPDWSAVAREADAVHLTVGAYLSASGRVLPVADDVATAIAGWDPDRTYWLTDVDDDASPAERWELDRHGEALWRAR
ncbi:hypothetical protein AB6N23_10750 [Cellulomonas sp. 179-A 9B4 NHS]|uniref:hypothetical protein n=1 Tax=Cellulomonas sp. 179-A 9B4 NHS TaxID=3142379 RepID=UPI0039A26C40